MKTVYVVRFLADDPQKKSRSGKPLLWCKRTVGPFETAEDAESWKQKHGGSDVTIVRSTEKMEAP